MADDGRIKHVEDRVEGTGEQFEGRAEQTVGSMTGDRTQQAEGLSDEVKGKLLKIKSELQPALDGDPPGPGPSGRH